MPGPASSALPDLLALCRHLRCPGPGDPDGHGSGLRAAAGGGLMAVAPGEAELGTDADLKNADLGDFGDLDPDDADLQAVLAEEDLGEAGLGDAGEVAGDLAGDAD